jgi:hypothetical protein
MLYWGKEDFLKKANFAQSGFLQKVTGFRKKLWTSKLSAITKNVFLVKQKNLKMSVGYGITFIGLLTRVSSETSFVSKQLKLEPKLVSALSETRRLFQLFRFNIETGSFGVSKQPKQTKDQPKQQQIC